MYKISSTNADTNCFRPRRRRIESALQRRSCAYRHARRSSFGRSRSADLGDVQLRRALGLDVSQHSDLYVGGQLDPGRHELEAGGVHRLSGELHCAGADAAEFASRGAVWNSLPRAGASLVRVLGANVAAVLRALVACGWFGIQTWIGGEAIKCCWLQFGRRGTQCRMARASAFWPSG